MFLPNIHAQCRVETKLQIHIIMSILYIMQYYIYIYNCAAIMYSERGNIIGLKKSMLGLWESYRKYRLLQYLNYTKPIDISLPGILYSTQ